MIGEHPIQAAAGSLWALACLVVGVAVAAFLWRFTIGQTVALVPVPVKEWKE